MRHTTRHQCILAALVLGAITACSDKPPEVDQASIAAKTPDDLAAHTKVFEKGVVKVTDRVHVAVGYGLANSIMIEGDDGIIIVDTMESVEEGRAVLAEFREITDKPIRAIVYTHNHTDHVMGSAAFTEDDPDVQIWAHASTQFYIDRVVNTIRPIISKRSMRMFGNHLTDAEVVNAGIGPTLSLTDASTLIALTPTHTLTDREEITIADVKMELVHAPGETADQIFVWLPDDKVLMPGDNIYETFPNLYTIRGTPYRDVTQWVASLDAMRRYPIEHLVPSHTRPVSGKQEVADVLRVYRDAIQFVHDQTVRYMNQGLTPDEIVERVKLPAHLANHSYLAEFYGTVEGSVRSIFMGYLGWFDGNATTLDPLGPEDHASRMIELAGGVEALSKKLEEAEQAEDHRWALELADALMFSPRRIEARASKARSLRALGAAESNPNNRHYYFTQAMELEREDFDPTFFPTPQKQFLAQLPSANFFRAMPVGLKAEETLDTTMTVQFDLTDTGETYSVQIRRGVAEVQTYPIAEPDATVTTTSIVWKEIAARLRTPASAIAAGEFSVDGKIAFLQFMRHFDRPN